jgi:hypothetical protein
MSIDLKQNAAGDLELVGNNTLGTGFIYARIPWDPASNATNILHTADRPLRVKSILGRVNVAGTDAGAVTAQVFKAPSGTALASGTLLHTGTFNLKGTAATNQTLTLSATDAALNIETGDTIGVVITGVLTSAVGGLTVAMTPR